MNQEVEEARNEGNPQSRGATRVLFVSHDSGIWGAQRMLLTLLSHIDRRICKPILVVPCEGALGRAASELDIPVSIEEIVHWIPGFHVASMGKRLPYLRRFLSTLGSRSRALERLIAYYEVDLVYTNTVTCVEGAIAAWRTGTPHIWHIHEPIRKNSELSLLFPWWLYVVAVNILSKDIICCSNTVAKEYPQLSSKTSIVYNGLPVPMMRDRAEARANVTGRIGLDGKTKLVAVVGALQPRKDHLTFLDAARRVSERRKDTAFLIVGTGSEGYSHLIRQRITELQLDAIVRMVGWWEGDIHDFLAAVDVLVISSEQESFGLTAIEALGVETPVVATRCGGPGEVVIDGVTGLLVPVRDPVAMADAISRLLQDTELAREIGANGRKHVGEHYGVEQYVRGIEEVIEKAVPLRRKA
jgi:glycosyltransferase involved in cell wall biosynthesis